MYNQKIEVNKDYLYVGFLIFVFIILAWRSQFGVDWNDEGFYVALVHRFYLGDIPFVHEWNMAQAFAIFMLPIYKIYILFNGTNTGIYLFFRIVYILINLFISIYLYLIFEKRANKEIACISALLFFIYARDGIPTLSYYAMSLQTLILGLLLFMDVYFSRTYKNVKLVFLGVILGISVASNPYSIIVYLYFTIYLVIKIIRKQIHLRELFSFLLGTVILTTMFIVYILRSVSVETLLNNLKFVLVNPDHPSGLSIGKAIKWFWYSIKPFGMYTTQELDGAYWYQFIGVIIVISIFMVVIIFHISKRVMSNNERKIIIFLMIVLCLNYIWNTRNLLGGSFISLSFLGMLIFLMDTNIKNREIFFILYLPGIGLSFAYQMASDTGINSMTIGYVISAMASLLIINQYLCVNKDKVVINVNYFLFIVLVIIFIPNLYLRVFDVYKDEPINLLTYEIKDGPHKGLYTNQNSYNEYMQITEGLEFINNTLNSNQYVMISAMLPWGYTWLDSRVGAPTVWGNYLHDERISQYFKIHPERTPNCIFVINENYGRNNRDNEANKYMKELMDSNGYKVMEYPFGTIYLNK